MAIEKLNFRPFTKGGGVLPKCVPSDVQWLDIDALFRRVNITMAFPVHFRYFRSRFVADISKGHLCVMTITGNEYSLSYMSVIDINCLTKHNLIMDLEFLTTVAIHES